MNSSSKVKMWRIKTKQRMVDAMGGKCCICGYNKTNNALAFHHLDPSEKGYNFGTIRASPIGWPKIINELKKCILVCNNCHAEIHAGIIDTSNLKSPEISKEFEDYRNLEDKAINKICPVCKGPKNDYQKTCSHKCAGIKQVDWSKYDVLELIKTHTKTQICDMIDISCASLNKRLKKLGFMGT